MESLFAHLQAMSVWGLFLLLFLLTDCYLLAKNVYVWNKVVTPIEEHNAFLNRVKDLMTISFPLLNIVHKHIEK